VMYALDHLAKKGFRLVIPPYMLRRKPLEGVISFLDFEDMVYKIEGEDLYLIATAEHPLASLHMDETIPRDELPLLYAGLSPCFRKEAGAHGKDTKGIFRVHQFTKVEQFVYCLPDESWEWHERLIRNAEELFQGLGIPYRVVNVCSGDLGVVAAKKYDLEAWMPAQGKYREMVSCSNTTDYQSYRLNIRFAKAKGAPAEGYVHTLNSTAIATTRAITAIVENYQEPDGTVRIPPVLRRYLEVFERAPKDYIEPRNRSQHAT
ncbi:MAG: serine--tRNA ligase, partial [Thermofilaceae archaeon]